MTASAPFAFLILLSPRLYAGGEIGVKLDKLSKTLVSGYEASFPKAEKVSLAVLPFHTDEELAKRRTGMALAELLTHSFRRYDKFKIVERMELKQIFEELKLNMSGIVDAEEALKIGRMGGAKLQVFGSMEKIGGRYHINARMVETESGEVFATAYETLPAELFEEEVKSYLAPVPETQALGFYFLYNFRDVPTASGPYSYSYTDGFGTNVTTVYPRALTMKQLGAGLRYNPIKKLQIDFAGIYSGKGDNLGATAQSTFFGWDAKFGSMAYRFLLNYDIASNRFFHVYAGGGMIWHQVYKEMTGSYSSPLIHCRVEFKPQARIALSIAANYEIKGADWRAQTAYDPAPSPTHKPSRLSIEPSIGFYF